MTRPITTVLFDLDETLSDHLYSLERAMTEVRGAFPALSLHTVPELMAMYQKALDEAFEEYLAKKITHEATSHHKIRLFFREAGAEASEADIDRFVLLYRKAYSIDRRATLGTVHTLKKLRERGYKIGVVTNGEDAVQKNKLTEIGIGGMVDAVIVSGAVGFPKPSPEIFAAALSALGSAAGETLMVGDNIQKDIEGALGSGIKAVVYAPLSKEPEMKVQGALVPVISHMEQLLAYLEIQ